MSSNILFFVNSMGQAPRETFNDFSTEKFAKYKTQTFLKHKEMLSSHLNYFDVNKLLNCERPWFFDHPPLFTHSDIRLVSTTFKYSTKDIYIPLEFDAIMTTIISKDCGKVGIFRISESVENLKISQNDVEQMIKNNCTYDEFLDYFQKYDVIFLSNLLAKLFNLFDGSLIPFNLHKIILKFSKLVDENEKCVCFRLLIVAMPQINRFLIESLAVFFRIISKRNFKAHSDDNQAMSLSAICRVVFPVIFFHKIIPEGFDFLTEYSMALEYIFKNIETLILPE